MLERHDEEPVGVDRLAGADQPVPRAVGAVGRARPAMCWLRGEAVGQQHGVAAVRREAAVGLVGERELGQHGAALEPEVARGEPAIGDRVERRRGVGRRLRAAQDPVHRDAQDRARIGRGAPAAPGHVAVGADAAPAPSSSTS